MILNDGPLLSQRSQFVVLLFFDDGISQRLSVIVVVVLESRLQPHYMESLNIKIVWFLTCCNTIFCLFV